MKESRRHWGNANEPTPTVSKKFYAYISGRVAAASLISAGKERTLSESMEAIDAYIATGMEPAPESSMETLMIFTILRPEIDRAMARSAAARLRAAKRRRPEVSAPLPNRRRRRLMLMEERRRQRKEAGKNKKRQAQKKHLPDPTEGRRDAIYPEALRGHSETTS